MPVLSNAKHEKFAQLIAKGESATSAYKRVYKAKPKAAESNGARLVGNDKVRARVTEIQGKAAELVEWSIADRLQFLKESAITPPSEVKMESRICQGEKKTKFGSYLLIPDKIRATVEYGRLAGDYKEKVEVDLSDPVLELIEQIRGGNK